jgi:quercetin dioxygenase-like cupin family protein
MRRPVFASLALTAVLATSFLALTSRAQETTSPEGMELPPGVALAILGQFAPFTPPAEDTGLLVLRLILEPGAAIPMHPHPQPEFGIIESGSVTVHTFEGDPAQVIRGAAAGGETLEAAVGEEVTGNAGDIFLAPPDNVSDTRAGDEGASVLILEFAPAADETPAA